MSNKYQKNFMKFLSDVELLENAEKAEYSLSNDVLNDILDKISVIAKKHNLHVTTDELFVLLSTNA